jgi:hypothetical protein
MYEVMNKLVDSVLGEEPSVLLAGPGAREARMKRVMMMDVLHALVGLSMREGVNRAIIEARARRDGYTPRDAEDLSARDQARDDAIAGRTRTRVRH